MSVGAAEVMPWVDLGISLVKMGVEWGTASAERRAALVVEADEKFAACRARVVGLSVVVADNNAAADAVANSKPDAPNPTRLIDHVTAPQVFKSDEHE